MLFKKMIRTSQRWTSQAARYGYVSQQMRQTRGSAEAFDKRNVFDKRKVNQLDTVLDEEFYETAALIGLLAEKGTGVS